VANASVQDVFRQAYLRNRGFYSPYGVSYSQINDTPILRVENRDQQTTDKTRKKYGSNKRIRTLAELKKKKLPLTGGTINPYASIERKI
jgi:hypothetical protein